MTEKLNLIKMIRSRASDMDGLSAADVRAIHQRFKPTLGKEIVKATLGYFKDLRIIKAERRRLASLLWLSDAQITSVVDRDGQGVMRKHVGAVADTLIYTHDKNVRLRAIATITAWKKGRWKKGKPHLYAHFKTLLKKSKYRKGVTRLIGGAVAKDTMYFIGRIVGFEFSPTMIAFVRRRLILPNGLSDLRSMAAVRTFSFKGLAAFAKDPHQNVRAMAAYVLGVRHSKDPRTMPILVSLLRDKHFGVRRMAAMRLTKHKDPRVRRTAKKIIAAYEKRRKEQLKKVSKKVPKRVPKKAKPVQRKVPKKAKPVQRKVAKKPEKIPPKIQALIKKLGHASPKVRAKAVYALGKINHPQSIKALKRALRDKNIYIRELARLSLRKLGVR